MRERRDQLEAMLATGQARLERARSRSLVVDTMVGVVQRERPVAVGILAASLAFRLFALMVPLTYVLVAGLGFAAQASATEASARPGDELGELVVASVAAASRSSDRAQWLALILGGLATLWAAAAVLEVLRWVHLLAWRLPPARARTSPWLVLGLVAGVAVISAAFNLAEQARADARGLASELTVILISAGLEVVMLAVLWLALTAAMPRPKDVPWTALVPGALLFAVGFLAFTLAVSLYFAPRAARASTVYGSLGVALVLLVSLFLFARLAVAAAELNATLRERRGSAG
jgi:membrane protein